MGSGRRARINEEIRKMRARLSSMIDQRSARAGARDNYLQAEFGFDSRGPYVARYMYLMARLIILYIARAIAPLLPEE